MADLSQRDYAHMLDMAVAVLESRTPESMWHLVGQEILEVFHATTTIFVDLRWRQKVGHSEGWAPEWVGRTPIAELVGRRMRQEHPLFRYTASGERRPATVDEVCDRADWLRSDCYHEAFEIYGTTRQMALPLPMTGEVIRGFIMGRPGKDFTRRETALAHRLQPLLRSVDIHVREMRRLRRPSEGEGEPPQPERIACGMGITPRELTVLNVLAEGLTAAAMARRLGISVRTVHAHLDRLYRKLGTRDRLATVLLAKDLGLTCHPEDSA
ncbi:DNA-binding CsgD family transcriptional regulator [Streptomyces sp. SAI-208]|uniref:helix-turn-helix transcriptional regulator n=1 Tax=Streptomyces sp. SAI-208 TaxID=2940550 RepID=UPI002476DEB3|nr:helix-turn-helix transcriptional regulator [Streptomyces sp. SAI-208]MDH6612724.1 DNA-binding CsgD family transcriptional regulator [Streptomyces sp. SAI-208]